MKGWVLDMEHVSTRARRGCVGGLTLRPRWAIALVIAAACGDNLAPPPDAPVPLDAIPIDAPPDVSDCWMRRVVTCGSERIELCVPIDGCAGYVCEGLSYAYCGPGSG